MLRIARPVPLALGAFGGEEKVLAFGAAGHGDLQSEDRSNLSDRGTIVKCNVLHLFAHVRSPSTIRSPVADAT